MCPKACVGLMFLVLMGGCGLSERKGPPPDAKKVHDHSGWWCAEHGIPEKDCSLCLPAAEVKRRFKDKGDWCQEHDRAKSQCFKCEPKLYEKYVAMYREQFPGQEPPRPPDEEFTK